jgi:hypothetical protein
VLQEGIAARGTQGVNGERSGLLKNSLFLFHPLFLIASFFLLGEITLLLPFVPAV